MNTSPIIPQGPEPEQSTYLLYPTLYPGVDAAYPGNPLPSWARIVAGYVGKGNEAGIPDTPHIWTAQEWNEYAGKPGIVLLPIYTHNYLGDPIADAKNACDAVEALGWAPGMPGSQRRIIALDMETLVAPGYITALGAHIYAAGFRAMVYNSNSVAYDNPLPIGSPGRWVADLVMNPPRVLGPTVAGVQYRWTNEWDYNVFSQDVFDGCGRGLRRG